MMWGADAWWWGWIMMVAFWATIVLLVVWAIRSSRSPDDRRDLDRAERRLGERFADGEIDADEYENRLEVLHRRA